MNKPYSTWTEEQREAHRGNVRAWRKRNPTKVREEYDKRNVVRRERYANDPEYHKKVSDDKRPYNAAQQRRKFQREKTAVFDHYGRICKCCGETLEEFLTIDHMDGDGADHRRQIGEGSRTLYRWLVAQDFPANFRTLCMNCNFALGHSGYCPHNKL